MHSTSDTDIKPKGRKMSFLSSKYLPAFIPVLFSLLKHFPRDFAHGNNIRKADKTVEKINTVEHMLVRLEKRVQLNRETYERIARRVYFWLIINSALLVAILIKLFFFS